MRLAAVTTSFPLRPGSSAGVFVRRLYEHLPSPWQIDVICPQDDRVPVLESLEGDRLRVRPVRYAPRRLQVLAQQPGGIVGRMDGAPWVVLLVPSLFAALSWGLLRAARHADVLHGNWALGGVIAGSVGALLGRPVVTTLRGSDVTRAERPGFDRLLLDAAVRGSDALICVSEAMADRLRARYPARAADIHVCLNGVDSAFFAVARSAPQSAKLRVAAVGSLTPIKGYDVLIEAIARMRCRNAVHVKIAGDGPELARLKELAGRLGVADNVELVGALPPTAIPAFLGAAELFVLSSRAEGRPNVVLEALAAGLPVISADLPAVDDLVYDGVNGWRVKVGDADSFAAALDQACAEPEERARRAAAALDGIKQRASDWFTTGARYDAVFREVLRAALLPSTAKAPNATRD